MMKRILTVIDSILVKTEDLFKQTNKLDNNFNTLASNVLELTKLVKTIADNQSRILKRIEELERIQFNPGWEERPVGQPGRAK